MATPTQTPTKAPEEPDPFYYGLTRIWAGALVSSEKQMKENLRSNDSEPRLPGFESCLIHSLAVWPWASDFASLGPSVNKG
ncbi:FXYD domain-containing ion transport regulator 7 isoform X2 [Pongo abelii]|uniref:FXYD domain-containing ion transport regulator 7 isoform X2 n=1 Tax=Pongo abelii TaxID=9601 RepID=UPI0023E8166B|nr:FXYD domain-containing ion transport regulator 7 isoform X2 [Pongo abelii]